MCQLFQDEVFTDNAANTGCVLHTGDTVLRIREGSLINKYRLVNLLKRIGNYMHHIL